MIIDFKEIPQANKSDGLQDSFELFARDFLEEVGYKIIEHPDRGQDEKKDMIVEDTRSGIGGETKIRFLVSCKHKAYSGKSVSENDEPNLLTRIKSHGCKGFIGVYSTLPSSGLNKTLSRLRKEEDIEYQIYDNKRIEKVILHSRKYLLMVRYFQDSYERFEKLYKEEDIKEPKIEIGKSSCNYPASNEVLLETIMTSNILLEIDKISEEFFNLDWSKNDNVIDKLQKYSKYSNKQISVAVMNFIYDASHLTRSNMPSNIITSIYSTVLAFFPTTHYGEKITEYDIQNGITATHIGFNITYDAMIHSDNFTVASYGLTILKYVYKYAKRKNITLLLDEVMGKYSELESTLERPERNDLENAKQLLSGFKNDIDTHSLSFPPLPAHLYEKMRADK